MFKGILNLDGRTNLEKEIDDVLLVMSTYSPASVEYTAMAENLERLYKSKAQSRVHTISPDTLLVVAGNLLGLAFIMNFEKADIITTKALGFVLKGRA